MNLQNSIIYYPPEPGGIVSELLWSPLIPIPIKGDPTYEHVTGTKTMNQLFLTTLGQNRLLASQLDLN